MNRRHFLKAGVTAAALSALMKDNFIASASNAPGVSALNASKKKIGLQLYSLRDDMGKDPDATLKEVAKMGYSFLESYGYQNGKFFGKSPKEFDQFVTDLGMKMTSSHTGFGVYQNDNEQAWDSVKKNMQDTKEAGAKWIVQAGYPGERFKTLDEVKALAEMFNRVGELAKQFGLKFALHNHRTEFRAISNRIPYQVYLDSTEKGLMFFQLDTGHAANEMEDYRMYMKLYPGRFGCMHLADTNAITKRGTEVGSGDVVFEDVFNLFEHAGVEDYYVEQEAYNFTPLVSVKKCYDYLNSAEFVKW